ncbi:hypothetical protein BH09BAC5_BH09BAC5_07710 [soil metagenome]
MKTTCKLFLILLCSVWFYSCDNKSKIEDTIQGWWTIDTLVYKGVELRYNLDLNTISFTEQGDCELPLVRNGECTYVRLTSEKEGFWEINESDSVPIKLTFDTKNSMFDGSYRLIFKKDPINKLLKMEIYSKGMNLICRKGLFSYDENIELIEELIRTSNGRK